MSIDDVLQDALRRAVADPGEHRLYRAGKLPGLFPSRSGVSADAVKTALAEGLLEIVRTEPKGKLLTEWVRVTPAGRIWVHERDSPAFVIAELKKLLESTQNSVPAWLTNIRQELASISEKLEHQAHAIRTRMDDLSERLTAALRRADLSTPIFSDRILATVPWASTVLTHLDRWRAAGNTEPCSLQELFDVTKDAYPELTIANFHAGLSHLAEARVIQLVPGDGSHDPEYAMIHGSAVIESVQR